jgi:hypothetical protein
MLKPKYLIYLGQVRGKRVVYKIGQAQRTCWERCEHADYLIGACVEIKPTATTDYDRKRQLNAVEGDLIKLFTNRYKVESGKEYFRIKGHNWEQMKKIFFKDMAKIIKDYGFEYEIYEGWALKGTY